MPTITVTLSTAKQSASDLAAAARTAAGLPPIPTHAKLRRIIGKGAGLTFYARSPLPATDSDAGLANNEATPILGNDLASQNLNTYWLFGENNGDKASLDIDY